MAIITDGTFSTRAATGSKRWTVPFNEEGDTVTRYFEQDYLILPASWTPVELTESQTVDGNTFYLVRETSPVDLGGVYRLTQTWAMLPRERTQVEQFTFTFRGLAANTQYAINTITSTSNSGGTTNITTDGSHGITTGDTVLIQATLTHYPSGVQTSFQVRRTANSGSGSTLNVGLIDPSGGSLSFLNVRKVDDGRDPRTTVVPSYVKYEYFKLGVSAGVSKVDDISIFEPELVIDSNGNETLTYSATTLPDRDSYISKINGGELIVAEHSSLRRWMGDIYERSTRYVQAE